MVVFALWLLQVWSENLWSTSAVRASLLHLWAGWQEILVIRQLWYLLSGKMRIGFRVLIHGRVDMCWAMNGARQDKNNKKCLICCCWNANGGRRG